MVRMVRKTKKYDRSHTIFFVLLTFCVDVPRNWYVLIDRKAFLWLAQKTSFEYSWVSLCFSIINSYDHNVLLTTNVNWIFLRGKKSSLKSIFYFPLLFKFIFGIKIVSPLFQFISLHTVFLFSDVSCRHRRRCPTFTNYPLHVITWLMSWPSDIQAQKVLEYYAFGIQK